MTRVDFWASDPVELWWFVEAARPQKTYAGGMTESEVAEIYEEAYGHGGG
jgi:hypothetical protein